MHIKSRHLLFLFIVLFVAIGLASCDETASEPLTVAINDWTGYQPLLLAQQLGYLNSQSVHLATLGSTTEALQKFRAGIVDAACVTLDEALLLKAEGYDISMVLVMDISNGADAIIAKPGIDTLAQLKGKSIGVENTALGAYVLARALDQANISAADINAIPINASQQASAFNDMDINAVVCFEPIKSQLIKEGGHVVFDSSMIPDEIVDVLVIRKSVLKQDSSKLTQTIYAWFKTLDYMHQHRDKFLTWLSKEQKIDKSTASKALDEIIFPGLEKNRILLKKNGQTTQTLEKMSRIMMENKLVLKRPDVETLVTDHFVK